MFGACGNSVIPKIRIRSEHLVGLLKGRFQCLKGLRQAITSIRSQLLAIEMVRTCLILHNLILDVEHAPDDIGEWEWVIDGLVEEDVTGDLEVWEAPHAGDGDPVESKRERIRRAYVISTHDSP